MNSDLLVKFPFSVDEHDSFGETLSGAIPPVASAAWIYN